MAKTVLLCTCLLLYAIYLITGQSNGAVCSYTCPNNSCPNITECPPNHRLWKPICSCCYQCVLLVVENGLCSPFLYNTTCGTNMKCIGNRCKRSNTYLVEDN